MVSGWRRVFWRGSCVVLPGFVTRAVAVLVWFFVVFAVAGFHVWCLSCSSWLALCSRVFLVVMLRMAWFAMWFTAEYKS